MVKIIIITITNGRVALMKYILFDIAERLHVAELMGELCDIMDRQKEIADCKEAAEYLSSFFDLKIHFVFFTDSGIGARFILPSDPEVDKRHLEFYSESGVVCLSEPDREFEELLKCHDKNNLVAFESEEEITSISRISTRHLSQTILYAGSKPVLELVEKNSRYQQYFSYGENSSLNAG
jgi:hypothetical protein